MQTDGYFDILDIHLMHFMYNYTHTHQCTH